MKIMDLSGDDEECSVEAVISKNKKTKQARLPFQSLGTDSSPVNKKRKTPASPECRTPKQAKVNAKENSFEVSEKISQDISIEKEIIIEKEEITSSENDDVKDSSKQVATEIQDSKNKKSTSKTGTVKVKKSEVKSQVNCLIKFFTKIDNKDKDVKVQSNSKSKTEQPEETSNVNNKSKEISEKLIDCKKQNSKENKNFDEKNNLKKSIDAHKLIEDNEDFINKSIELTTDDDKSDSECKAKSESDNTTVNNKNEKLPTQKSNSTEPDSMEVDSDICIFSNESHDDDNDDDDDSDKSDTDSKKTEHEDTDSKDDKTTDNQATTPTRNVQINNCSVKLKKLTPKQMEKKMEVQKKRENREKQRLEREKKLQEERENRKKEKEEKKREREEKAKLLIEQKKKDKELKELKKQAEIEQKQKEKEAKEEEKKRREEEKQRREEEKQRKEEEKLEAERKKLKAASNFVSFFVAKKPTETKPAEEENKIERRNFMPFEIKVDMRVAPIVRRSLSENEKIKLDKVIETSNIDKNELYINELLAKKLDIRKSGRTWPFEATDDIIVIDEDEESSNFIQPSKVEKHRAKLFLFEENRRPPYWGTWRKSSKTINPRKPFAMDTNWFDYEIDSDDEWEEEEPGESLHGSDDEKEKDEENAEENEYDVDNDFMVPHGYLSEEEIGADEEDEDDMNPEKQETKLKILGEQFEAERNAKTKKLKPKVIGCVWLNKDNNYPENTPVNAVQYLTARHIWVNSVPLVLTAPADAENTNDNENGTPSSKINAASTVRKAKALEDAIPDLIRLFHGNTHGRGFLLKEFLEFWSKKNEGEKPIPKLKLQQKIRDIATWIACPDPGPMHEKLCWYVAEEFRIKYCAEEKLELPNTWSYSLTPKRKRTPVETPEKPEEKDKEKEKEKDKEKDKKSVPLITHFTKALTAEEKQKQLAEKSPAPLSKLSEKSSTASIKITPPVNKLPKRALLISVPRGEPFPKSPRISLMDKFVTKDSADSNNSIKINKSKEDTDDDDCRIIDNSDEQIDILSISSELTDDKKKNGLTCNVESENDQNESDQSAANVSKSSDVDIIGV